MSKSIFNTHVQAAKLHYLPASWSKIEEYFGEEDAEDLDFSANFDYKDVYDRGDKKECEVFFHIAAVQKFCVDSTFLINTDEVLLTKVQLKLWMNKLYDKASDREHTWLN